MPGHVHSCVQDAQYPDTTAGVHFIKRNVGLAFHSPYPCIKSIGFPSQQGLLSQAAKTGL